MTRRAHWQVFGRRIVVARQARGWSQRALAAEAGVSPTSLGGLERGESDPLTSRVAPKVAIALGWPADAADQTARGVTLDELQHGSTDE